MDCSFIKMLPGLGRWTEGSACMGRVAQSHHVGMLQAAECEGQDCGGAHGGQEGQWDAEDAATADDKEYATGAAGVERAPSGDGSFSGR